MKFVVGIGNPGAEYDGTRHNVGFAAVEAAAAKAGARWNEDSASRASFAPFGASGALVRSKLYVNHTGETVSAIRRKHGVWGRDFLFVCDDVNLAFGKLRLRASGSSGGHHGLESVIDALKSDEFPRLRIGVGNGRMPKDDIVPFVLAGFEPGERRQLDKILEKAVSICESWSHEGFDAALNKL